MHLFSTHTHILCSLCIPPWTPPDCGNKWTLNGWQWIGVWSCKSGRDQRPMSKRITTQFALCFVRRNSAERKHIGRLRIHFGNREASIKSNMRWSNKHQTREHNRRNIAFVCMRSRRQAIKCMCMEYPMRRTANEWSGPLCRLAAAAASIATHGFSLKWSRRNVYCLYVSRRTNPLNLSIHTHNIVCYFSLPLSAASSILLACRMRV